MVKRSETDAKEPQISRQHNSSNNSSSFVDDSDDGDGNDDDVDIDIDLYTIEVGPHIKKSRSISQGSGDDTCI